MKWSGNERKRIGNSIWKNNEGMGEEGNRQNQKLGPMATGKGRVLSGRQVSYRFYLIIESIRSSRIISQVIKLGCV